MKDKIAKIKQKIQENGSTIAIAAVASIVIVAQYIQKQKYLEMLNIANEQVENIEAAIKHVEETGHSVTFDNQNGDPRFRIVSPDNI